MSIRQFLISTIAFAILPTAVLRAADNAEYVSGTVKAIPMNSVGIIDLYDAKALKFMYGEAIYKLPYSEITGTEVAKSDTRHVLKKVPVPSLFGRKKETLTISYKDPAGNAGKMSFDMTHRLAYAVQNTVAAQKAAAQAALTNEPAEWWGDQVWKTARNKSTWEAGTASTTQPAPAAAPATTKN